MTEIEENNVPMKDISVIKREDYNKFYEQYPNLARMPREMRMDLPPMRDEMTMSCIGGTRSEGM
jgi:hypothetical protein